jgi:bifunctional non-homologous end joining protein LigD
VSSRGTKLFVDPSQNDYADTLAAAYSVRPYHTPTVSTPLELREVNAALAPTNFTMENIHRRLERKGDLFADVFKPAIQKKNSAIIAKHFL